MYFMGPRVVIAMNDIPNGSPTEFNRMAMQCTVMG
jgi:hypothetical protein